MDIRESFDVALSSLRVNKMRSGLTMLGIIIGVSAVIAMMALGKGASDAVKRNIQSLGNNLISIFPGQVRGGGMGIIGSALPTLSLNDAVTIATECPSISNVAPQLNRFAQLKYSNKTWNTRVVGTIPVYPFVRNFQVERGSFFTEQDLSGKRKVCVIGETVRKSLFNEGEDPLGATIKVNRVNFTVIGILKEKGAATWFDQDDQIIVPLTTAMTRLFGEMRFRGLSTIDVQAVSEEMMEKAQVEIEAILRRTHKLLPNEDNDFTVRNQADILSTMQETSKTLSLLLAGIALVSLIVGGIGIMNIMLVSVTERTREIGVRKAIGARRRDIMVQFLIEAVVISLFGGVIGILLGVLGSMGLASLAKWNTRVEPLAIFLAFIFSSAIGIFFGYYPARKAASLDPIEALRYE